METINFRHGRVYCADVLQGLQQIDSDSVHCCVTSPPYWGLRDYGIDGQIGHESSPEEFVARMVEVFRAVRRVLRPDGVCWLNLGDTYAQSGMGGNPKNSPHQLQNTSRGSLTGKNRNAPPGLKTERPGRHPLASRSGSAG